MPRWTEQAKLRQAELIRGWKPWTRSTGAKTPEGKAISSQNARRGAERRQRELVQAEIELAAAIAKVARLTSRKAGNWPF